MNDPIQNVEVVCELIAWLEGRPNRMKYLKRSRIASAVGAMTDALTQISSPWRSEDLDWKTKAAREALQKLA